MASNPWDADSEYELGEAYRLQANLEPAEEHYRRSIQIDPNLGTAQTAIGDLLFSKGKPEEAQPHLEAGVPWMPMMRPLITSSTVLMQRWGGMRKQNARWISFLSFDKNMHHRILQRRLMVAEIPSNSQSGDALNHNRGFQDR